MGLSMSIDDRCADGAAHTGVSDGVRRQLADVLVRLDGLTGTDLARLPADMTAPDARRRLAAAWRSLTPLFAGVRDDMGRLDILTELLRDLRFCEDRVSDEHVSCSANSSLVVRAALHALWSIRTVHEFGQRIPEIAAGLGFDRVLFSLVHESVWLPESVFVVGDPLCGADILRAGRERPRSLHNSLLESTVVRRRQAMVVTDTEGRTDLHSDLVAAIRTRSYVVAPVVTGRRVIGLLHADCHRPGRAVGANDRDLLWLFSEGAGQAMGRVMVADAMARAGSAMEELAAATTVRPAERWTVASTPDFDSLPSPREGCDSSSDGGMTEPDRLLTRRQVQVLALIGDGLTNAQIARRLLITEGTVKSHIKIILRSLGAANRAEAVSLWSQRRTCDDRPPEKIEQPSGHMSRPCCRHEP
jgi:DNA-binding CsgD family transcriptional regulator